VVPWHHLLTNFLHPQVSLSNQSYSLCVNTQFSCIHSGSKTSTIQEFSPLQCFHPILMLSDVQTLPGKVDFDSWASECWYYYVGCRETQGIGCRKSMPCLTSVRHNQQRAFSEFAIYILDQTRRTNDLLRLVLGVPSIATIFISLFSFSHHYMFRPPQAILRWTIQIYKM
jgi:hypothetical protein